MPRAVRADTSCFYYYHAPTQTSSWKRPTLAATAPEPVSARQQSESRQQEDIFVGSSAGVRPSGNACTRADKDGPVNEDLPREFASTSPQSLGGTANGARLLAVGASASVDEETHAVNPLRICVPLSHPPPPPRPALRYLAGPAAFTWLL